MQQIIDSQEAHGVAIEVQRLHKDHNLPVIRIVKAVISNFKSVGYGEVEFACGKPLVPQGTHSDILGLYGQNGSGKTAFIEVLNILRELILGNRVPYKYASAVSLGEDYSDIEFTFDLQYPDGKIRSVVYSFRLQPEHNEEIDESGENIFVGDDCVGTLYSHTEDLVVVHETIKMSGDFGDKKLKLQPVIDTSGIETPFGPKSKWKYFVGQNTDQIKILENYRQEAKESFTSFIFKKETMDVFWNCSEYSEFYQVLGELYCFAYWSFHVVDTRDTGHIQTGEMYPFQTRYGQLLLHPDIPSLLPCFVCQSLADEISSMNEVLSRIIPGLKLGLLVYNEEPIATEDGPSFDVQLISVRGDRQLPLKNESDGVRKIISVLWFIIQAYNEKSCTVVVDELDAGIFEYLLGEILEIFEESGRGQLIFTSHNLRPLEVLDKKHLCFTTTNPQNRYIRLKGVRETNNLRDTYFRAIFIGDQDENLYDRTKKSKIMTAMRKAYYNYGQPQETEET